MSRKSTVPSLAAAALLCLTGLAACSDSEDPQGGPGPDEPTTSATEGSPTEEPTSPESPESPESPGGSGPAGGAVPAYFVGEGPDRPRLFREFRRVEGDRLLGAAELVAGGAPDDADYRTLWPAVEIESVQPTDGLLLVTLADDGFTTRPDGMSRREARLAMQQMVYTLQGVQQERVPVQFDRPDGPARLFDLDIGEPFRQAPALDVLNHVNITAPEEGATVSGDTLEISGVANSFEANVVCGISGSEDGAPFTAEGWMGERLFPFSGELDVSGVGPGEVSVFCRTDDPSGGAEGVGAMTDTKTVTIR